MTSDETPRLADRLSALVGTAAPRADEAAAAAAEERAAQARSALTQQLAEVHDRVATSEAAVRGHVDEIGGAVVLRVDELHIGLQELLSGLTASAGDSAALLAALQAEIAEVRDAVAELQRGGATAEGDVAALAAGVVGISDRIEAIETNQGALAEAVSFIGTSTSEAATTATLTSAETAVAAARDQAEEAREDIARLEQGIEDRLTQLEQRLVQRVDEAALALAETFLGLLAGQPAHAGQTATAFTQRVDQDPPVSLVAEPASLGYEPDGGDELAGMGEMDEIDTEDAYDSEVAVGTFKAADAAEIELELAEQAIGTEEGSAVPDDLSSLTAEPAEAANAANATRSAKPGVSSDPYPLVSDSAGGRRRGLFRR